MKRSKIAMIFLLLLIPLTIWVGGKLPGRSYYLTSTLVLLEVMAPFFLSFESRNPQARTLVVIAVLCALAVAGRVVIPLPYFKAAFAIIFLSGVAFGPESGFLVGATTALVSNFFYGQGAFTPWQMVAYGAMGLVAAWLFHGKHRSKNIWLMALAASATVMVVVGPLLDTCTVFLALTEITWPGAKAIYLSGLPVNGSQAVATFLMVRLLGNPLLEKLDRVKRQYGMTEDDDGI